MLRSRAVHALPFTLLCAAVLAVGCTTESVPTVSSIAVTPSTATLSIGDTQQLAVKATLSDGTTPTVTDAAFVSSSQVVATVSSSGLVTARKAGSTTITATSGGKSATATITVSAASLSSILAAPATAALMPMGTQQLTVTGTFGDGTTADLTAMATYASDRDTVATVNAAGLVTGVAEGSATITVTASGKTATVAITVTTPALTSIAVTPSPLALQGIGASQQLTVTGTFEGGATRNVTAQSTFQIAAADGGAVISISAGGLVTSLAAGNANFTATLTLAGITRTATVAVSVAAPTEQMDLPVSFDIATVNYGLLGFAGAEDSRVVADPTDATNRVAQVGRSATAATFAGTTLTANPAPGAVAFQSRIPLAANATRMTVRVYVPAADVVVRLKVEDHSNPGISVETEATATAANTWQTLTFNFANQASGTAVFNPSNTYDKATIFFDFGKDGATAGARNYYFDDMAFVPAVVVDAGPGDAGPGDSGTVTPSDAGTLVVFGDDYLAGVTFAPYGGSTNALTVDTTQKRSGTSSLAIAVITGGYTGGVLTSATDRDLSAFNALTFWLKASKVATLNVSGLGDTTPGTAVEMLQLPVNDTTWTKYTLPLPKPSVLGATKGLFSFAEGPEDGVYTLYVDDIQYESLPSVGAPVTANIGWPAASSVAVGATLAFDRAPNAINWGAPVTTNGGNLANVGFRYFNLVSSAPGVATVDGDGVVTGVGPGTTNISATFNSLVVPGLAVINVTAPLGVPTTIATAPTAAPGTVTAMFSSTYPTLNPVDSWSTSWSGCCNDYTDSFLISGHAVKKYVLRHFTGIEFLTSPIDATARNFFHLDVWTPNATELQVRLVNNVGPTQSESTVTFNATSTPALTTGAWIPLDIPMTAFSGLSGRAALGQMLLLVPTGSNATFYFDNIYFHN